jgi:hypothetical protein
MNVHTIVVSDRNIVSRRESGDHLSDLIPCVFILQSRVEIERQKTTRASCNTEVQYNVKKEIT